MSLRTFSASGSPQVASREMPRAGGGAGATAGGDGAAAGAAGAGSGARLQAPRIARNAVMARAFTRASYGAERPAPTGTLGGRPAARRRRQGHGKVLSLRAV